MIKLTKNIDATTMESVKMFVTESTRISFVVIMIILFVIIMLLNKFSYHFAIWTGVTTILSSIIYIIIGIAIKSIFDGSCFTNVSPDIVNLFANNIANIILTSGLVTLGLGVIQLIYYRVMKKIKINE